MVHDESLAARLRLLLTHRPDVLEKKMFGGVAFMLDGKMFIGIVKDELMVRVGPIAHDESVAQPHARIMDFTGRPMVGYVFVAPKGFASEGVLQAWIDRGLRYVATIDRAEKKPRRPADAKTVRSSKKPARTKPTVKKATVKKTVPTRKKK